MKNKLLVTIYVPMLERDFDIFIPNVKKIGAIKKMIGKIIEESTDDVFVYDDTKHLYDKVTGDILDENQFVKYSTIKNGSRLILY